MTASAKVFLTGNSQAVRLPKSFRIDANEVWISRNEATGEIILQPKPREDEMKAFFDLLEATPKATAEFIPPRDDSTAADPLTEWETAPIVSSMPSRQTHK